MCNRTTGKQLSGLFFPFLPPSLSFFLPRSLRRCWATRSFVAHAATRSVIHPSFSSPPPPRPLNPVCKGLPQRRPLEMRCGSSINISCRAIKQRRLLAFGWRTGVFLLVSATAKPTDDYREREKERRYGRTGAVGCAYTTFYLPYKVKTVYITLTCPFLAP